MNVPPQTNEIFEILSKGQFICSNSTHEKIQKLYEIMDEKVTFENLSEYFSKININLEKGDEYFVFSRQEAKADLERKIETASKWIDILDFVKTFENSFGSGYRFSPSDIDVKVRMDVNLKDKMEGLKKYTGEGSYTDRIKKILDMLAKDGFIELENTIVNQYKVLASIKYLENLVLSIAIPEEIQHEIPE
ncbi:hypothetical protein BH23BAC1_BH23BAC1_18720 [soil metagenome]